MATSFLTLTEFKDLATIPEEFITEIETKKAGWTLKQLELLTADIVSRLDKRYGPWSSPYPLKVQQWLRDKCVVSCMLRRGVDPTDPQFQTYVQLAQTADDQIREAADAVNGLFDLPLRSDTTATGISKGAPLSYTEASPFVWTDLQRETGILEDESGSGTNG